MIKKLLSFAVLLLLCVTTFAQSSNIQRLNLYISTDQTTVLVFAAPICEDCVDRGHPDIATEMVTGMKNVLRVKARTTSLPPSNLTVITEDGRIYAFYIFYSKNPPVTVMEVKPPDAPSAQFSHDRLSDASITQFMKVLDATPAVRNRPTAKTSGRIRISLADIYLKGDVLFFKFSISNASSMDYDMNLTRYYVRDKKRAKRTAKLEKPLPSLSEQLPPQGRISSGRKANLVVAFPKFTIADNKLMVIEIFEKNGDRPLTLYIKGHQLLHTRGD
ncbi:conjugative transposon protein TraN [Chitinophaga sp. NPDC101104]|uniref:conjugative transposon protein TraN n=1 Tax=Chitinophaga sp. NPDC101104 TaxID=3390561 RepID=UPI003D08AC7A